MPIAPGTKLGPYTILSPLGAGGMGEVHRAHDERLGPDVASKVLPASFTGDPDRLRRFAQEARAIAALNHPNILGVHDIGQQDGIHYIVTEFLEGRTLRELLMDGPVPVRKTLHIFQQIASGLAAAHNCGIIHLVAGFANRQLVERVGALLQAPYSCRQATYDLRRLKRKGLIERSPKRTAIA